MLMIKDKKLGECELLIHVDSFSAVDSYIQSGFSNDLNRFLTEEELIELDEVYAADVQDYAWQSGGTRNHN